MATIIGYIRPFSRKIDQTKDDQRERLSAAGASTVFLEKTVSKTADRPELRRALDSLGDGDMLVVSSLDRLARTPTELYYILLEIIQRGSSVQSVQENLTVGADTSARRTENSTFLTHLKMITVFEHALLNEWQHESISASTLRRETRFSKGKK